MEKGRIEFSISFLELEGNSEQNGYVQQFCHINSNCVFSNLFFFLSGLGGFTLVGRFLLYIFES